MANPEKKFVEHVLEDVQEQIVSIILAAWDDWKTSPHPGIWRCKRSRANFLWEQIIEHAHSIFGETPRIKILEGQETFNFLVKESVLFRFKKANGSGLTANVPTQLALAFHDHKQDLFGPHNIRRVEVVYQLNTLETEVADILVVCRNGDIVVWSYSLLDASLSVGLAPPLPIAPPGEAAKRLVRPRGNVADHKRKNRGQ